ncbi:MAG: helix-turn-helix domain-containing protein [Inquilinus sp.]|nr:helix-turn-helix domain-containing protein [Inquilinus sp.]
MTVGARMRDRVRQLGISEAEAARRCGISARRFSFYVNDQRQPDFDTVRAICEALRVSPNYLFGLDDEPNMDITADQPPEFQVPEDYVPLAQVVVRPGMGGPAPSLEEDGPGERLYFPPRLIRDLRADPEQLRIMVVEGPSMAPALENQDQVIIDLSRTNPSQPGIFVLWDGYGLVCKWVERIPNTDPPRLRIVSENPRFQPYEALEHDEATIIGRVVWFARRL